MKTPHQFYRKNLLSLIMLLLLVLSLLNALSLNTVGVSAVEYPSICIEPAVTEGTLTPGSNYTISICTDYNGNDIWGWDFTLTYDPRVLHGGINKTDTWTGDNVTRMFDATGTPVVQNSEEVYVNQTIVTRITERTDVWIGDNVTRTFCTTQPVFPESETVLVGGFPKKRDVHYTIDYSTGNITFEIAPETNAEIKVVYDIWGDYTINYSTGTIEFPTPNPPPPSGVEIKATYLYGGINNGDLITTAKHPSATFKPGAFDNTIGKLSLTGALFLSLKLPMPTTSGPGTLANITFTVVGFGACNITLVPVTDLLGYTQGGYGDMYYIIDAKTMPNHIQHGYLLNVQPIHDVAVRDLVAPATAVLGDLIPIYVTVINEGSFTETFHVTVHANITLIGNQPNNILTSGNRKTLTFNWNTIGFTAGNYMLNTTAIDAEDEKLANNNLTKTIELKTVHDVAITSIEVPDEVAVGELVFVNVTVTNQGSYDENVTVTVFYDDTPINTTVIDVLPLRESEIVKLSWNTTDLSIGMYTIKATATIALDEDPSDNTNTRQIELKFGYDVEVVRILAPYEAVVGELVNITVIVKNVGVYDATDFDVKVTYDAGPIGTQSIELLLSGDSTSLSFNWDTTDVDPAAYKITAEAILATDEDLTNNKDTKSIFIKAPPIASFTFSPIEPIVAETVTFNASASYDPDLGGEIVSYAWDFGDGTTKVYVKDVNLTAITTHAYTAAGTYTVTLNVTDKDSLTDTATTDVKVLLHDIAITNVTASPNKVKIGEPVSINVTVVNEGTEKETFNVTVYYGDTIIETRSVTELASGASQSLIFSWDTSDVTAGTYTIKALATNVTDETDTDDNTFTDGTVKVEETPALGILLYVAAAGASAIIIAAVAIYFLRIRKPKPT